MRLPKQIFGPLAFDRADKSFFFNYEELRQPVSVAVTNQLFTPEAEQGTFLCPTSGVTRSVNLLNLAASKGSTSTWNPVVKQMLAGMRASAWEDLDVGLVKQIRFTEQNNLEMRAEFLNALNEVNFNFTASCTSNSLNSCQVTGDQNSPRRVQIVLRLNF